MAEQAWIKEFPGAITICDAQGIILEMNDKAAQSFETSGGRQLIGSALLDCHPEPARAKLVQLLEARHAVSQPSAGRRAGGANVYTIEKNGVHKLIYQSPWYQDGEYRGLIELSLEIPAELPHFIRTG